MEENDKTELDKGFFSTLAGKLVILLVVIVLALACWKFSGVMQHIYEEMRKLG